ncbi:MAG: MSEP-CTERM sorting domain-containing protein [Saprospiraceae bacterium]
MKNLLHPKWLFLINTLPITIYLILSGFEFSVVHSLLEAEDLITWGIYAGILAIVAGGILWYTFQLTYKNKEVSAKYAMTVLAIFVPYVVTHLFYFEEVLWGIPNWMIAPDFSIYVVTFLMPTIIHALFVLVQKLSIETFDEGWKNLLAAAAIPFLIYLFIQIVLPFWDLGGGDAEAIFSLLIFSFVALLFLFFVIRGAYFMISKRGEMHQGWKLFWRVCIAIVCPIAGLMLNQGFIDGFRVSSGTGVFGNFGNSWVYVMAVINGILVCLPELENPKYRLAVFGGRAIGFSYVTYFFLVFLPFLPLSVVGVIAFGLGFLMLTPLLLFIMQSRFLSTDFKYLKSFYSKDILRVLAVVGFLIIPTIITISYLNDKKVLNETLDYLYYPDYSKDYDLNKKSINRILTNIKAHDRNSRGFIMENPHHTPFLSRFYTHLVLDNMTLSGNKIRKIEAVVNRGGARMQIDRNRNDTMIHITNIDVESTYDSEQKAWRTWVNFEMTNQDTLTGQREYDTTFDLPAGCYISDYYLDIEDRREHGILAEKRAAIWVYQQITRVTRRDPGLLNYVGADKVRFRVFPFIKEEVRTTGIEFLHKEPTIISIDDFEIQLGNYSKQEQLTTVTDLTEKVQYISAFAKSKLEKVERQPYYHFIIDASSGQKYNIDRNAQKLSEFIVQQNIDLAKAEFNFTNTYSTIFTQKDFKTNGKNDWQTAYKNQSFEGGFFVERAIEKALLNAYNNRKNEFPIIVVVSESTYHLMIMTKEFSNWKMMYPELSEFYFLSDEDKLVNHSLIDNPIQPIDTFQINQPLIKHSLINRSLTTIDSVTALAIQKTILAYPNAKNPVAYLLDNGQASIVMKSTKMELDFKTMEKNNWKSALTMHGSWLSQNLHPETAETAYYELVRASFKSNVLTPTTSFLALENDAQKAMLRKKQKEALLGNKALDIAGQQNTSMSEPELWLILLLFGAFVWWRKRKVSVL